MRHLSIVLLSCLVASCAFAEPDAEPEHRALETNNLRLTEKDIMPFLYWSLNQQHMQSNANKNRNQFVRVNQKQQQQPCDDLEEELIDSEEMTDDNLEMDANVQPLDEDEDDMEEPETSLGVIEAYVDVKSGAIIISESAIKSILNGNYISLTDMEDDEEEDVDGLGKATKVRRRRRGGKGKKRGKKRGNKRRRNNRRRRPIKIQTRPRGQRVRYN